jgi:hypothetical protein
MFDSQLLLLRVSENWRIGAALLFRRAKPLISQFGDLLRDIGQELAFS